MFETVVVHFLWIKINKHCMYVYILLNITNAVDIREVMYYNLFVRIFVNILLLI